MTSPLPETAHHEATDEPLSLSCPACGGGLSLHRRHLGITGHCVHCRTPLTALEKNGFIQIVAGLDPHCSPGSPETSAPAVVEPPAGRPLPAENPAPAAFSFGSLASGADAPATPSRAPALFHQSVTVPPPREEEEEEIPPSVLSSIEPAGSPYATTSPAFVAPEENPFPPITSGFTLTPPSTGSANILLDRNDLPEVSLPPVPAFRKSAIFGDAVGAAKGYFSFMFKNEDDSSQINSAWGTRVPGENLNSISAFSTGSASKGGFAESLFREKVVKESEKIEAPLLPSPLAGKEESPLTAPEREECGKKSILDDDGRPMKPMTKGEEVNFARHLFASEKSHQRPRLVEKVLHTLVILAIPGAVGMGIYFVTPEEKLAGWKEKAYLWLEPGLAILDYVPEGLRPDWLPRTELGIDAGVDEDGNAKEKMNAFEGLKKLENDTGNRNGAAEGESEKLNQI